MKPPDVTSEDFLKFAVARWFLTAEEAEKVRKACAETGSSADETAASLGLLEPTEVRTILAAVAKFKTPAAPSSETLPGDLKPRYKTKLRDEWMNRRYHIIEVIAVGGMGRIYMVEDTQRNNERLALKTLIEESLDPFIIKCFEREFKILSGLRHPNVETVYDYGKVEEGPEDESGRLFFTCELLKGEDLLNATSGKTWREIVPLVVQVCRGLQFVHAHDIIHYDVKPENILVCDDGRVRLVDFGLAGHRRKQGSPDPIMGTIPYMAPELIRHDSVDHRADIYSLGVLIYELLTRDLPFPGDTSMMLQSHLEQPPPQIGRKMPDLPQGFEGLITRMLAKSPAGRPPSCNEVIHSLSEISGVEFQLETKTTLKGYVSSGALIGREKELCRLKELWRGAREDRPGPRVATVTGEAGLGKSRLVREFRIWAQTEGSAVVEAKANQCLPEPFGLMRDVLEQVVRQIEVWEHTALRPLPQTHRPGGRREVRMRRRAGPRPRGGAPQAAGQGQRVPSVRDKPEGHGLDPRRRPLGGRDECQVHSIPRPQGRPERERGKTPTRRHPP
jgi:hypothetical protein